MLSDTPFYCEVCEKWVSVNDAVAHAAKGHDVHEMQIPIKVKQAVI